MVRRLVLVAVSMVVLALARPAAAAPCQNCGPPPGGPEVASGPTRGLWLVWAGTVNGAITGVDTYTYLTGGERNHTVTGLGFVMSIPVVLYGIDFIKRDNQDAAAWTLTAWSLGVLAHGFWPVIESRFRSTATDKKTHTYRLGPAPIVAWDSHKTHAGLSLAGSF